MNNYVSVIVQKSNKHICKEHLHMSNYNDFDLDIRSTHNSGPVDPQSVIPVTVTCNCTYGPICHATELLCTPGNICDITMGCSDGCTDLVSLENRPKLILIVGLLVVDGVRVKQYMYS